MRKVLLVNLIELLIVPIQVNEDDLAPLTCTPDKQYWYNYISLLQLTYIGLDHLV